MTVLGTTVADPYWRQNKLADAAEALSFAMGAHRERKERKRLQAELEIKNFVTMAQDMPEIAVPWGTRLQERYGEDYPWLGAFTNAIASKEADRKAERERILSAGNKYLDNLGQLEQGYSTQQQAVEQMPDVLPFALPTGSLWPGEMPSDGIWGSASSVEIPNATKIGEQERLSAVQPSMFPLVAAHKMSPRERAAARLSAQTLGFELPTEFDPFSQLDAKGKALVAAQNKLTKGPVAEWAFTEAGLQPTRAKLQEQAVASDMQAKRLAAQVESQQKAGERQRAHLERQDELLRQREERRFKHQTELETQRANRKNAGLHALSDAALDENEQIIEEWREGLKIARGGEESQDAPEAQADYMKQEGTPKRMPAAHAKQIELAVKSDPKLAGASSDDLLQIVYTMTELYTSWTALGVTPKEALDNVLSGKPLPINISGGWASGLQPVSLEEAARQIVNP